MGFFAALRILIGSVPALMQLLVELAGWLKATFGDNPAKAIEEHAAAFKLVREAKTPDEKAKAAAAISKLISKL